MKVVSDFNKNIFFKNLIVVVLRMIEGGDVGFIIKGNCFEGFFCKIVLRNM